MSSSSGPPFSASGGMLPLKRYQDVAVIGAGISGVATAAHLIRRGLNVTVFERSDVAGGVWHFDPRAPLEPPYPNEHPPPPNRRPQPHPHARGEDSVDLGAASLLHAPPSPCYAGLKNNVPTSLMRSVLMGWPEGTEEIISQRGLEQYIQDLAVHTGVQDSVHYHTRVDDVWKEAPRSEKWNVRTTTLLAGGSVGGEPAGGGGSPAWLEKEWQFDAVVVASGHYHEPKVPDLPGLSLWKSRFPEAVIHSKAYRTPGRWRDKVVLIVGGGVSANDIAQELHGVASKVYVSSRGGPWDLPVPETSVAVGGVAEFVVAPSSSSAAVSGEVGEVRCQDGSVLRDVERIIIAAGYLTSYPFLRGLQDPSLGPGEATDEVIVTGEGILTHNLHRDIWYIPDPTLAFVGVLFYVSTFSLFDFQGEVVSSVLAGQARLPPGETMRREYGERKARAMAAAAEAGAGGAGARKGNHLRGFHSLMGKDVAYMDEIREWINEEAVRFGFEEMPGVDEAWLAKYESFKVAVAIRRGLVAPEELPVAEQPVEVTEIEVQSEPLVVTASA